MENLLAKVAVRTRVCVCVCVCVRFTILPLRLYMSTLFLSNLMDEITSYSITGLKKKVFKGMGSFSFNKSWWKGGRDCIMFSVTITTKSLVSASMTS